MDRQTSLVHVLDGIKESPRILVVGDLMLDRYTYGGTERISQEAPVLVLKANHGEHRLGGAASVANMLSALDAEVSVAGVVGDDPEGQTIAELFEEACVETTLVAIDESRPTTLKERFVGRSGSGSPSQILRVDTESTSPISSDVEMELLTKIEQQISQFDAILVSDYNKGVCTEGLVTKVVAMAGTKMIPVLVDPGRDRDYAIYKNVTLVKPNRHEAQAATQQTIRNGDDASCAGQQLCKKHDIGMAVITLDADGVCLVDRTGEGDLFPTAARSVYDITGAGDMVLSILGICFASDLLPQQAVELANFAAGMEVDRNGVATISRAELLFEINRTVMQNQQKSFSIHEASVVGSEYHRQGKHVVFTNGCFDLLHVGHVTYLEEAASLGDILIVGVNSDQSVRRLKGPERPIINEADRVAMLTSLACVDHVIIFDDDTPCELLRKIRPDVLVKGGTYAREEVVGYEIVEAYGGRIVLADVVGGVSTTKIVESVGNGRRMKRAG